VEVVKQLVVWVAAVTELLDKTLVNLVLPTQGAVVVVVVLPELEILMAVTADQA
jgi:hypothetical protein